jgi:hypothetical protein
MVDDTKNAEKYTPFFTLNQPGDHAKKAQFQVELVRVLFQPE